MRAALAAVLFLALPVSALALAPALTVPPNGISGCATLAEGGGGVVEDPATFQSTPAPGGGLDVTVDAAASDGIGFRGLLLRRASPTACTLLGTGCLDFGVASGTLQLQTSSTPDELLPTPVNAGAGPFRNDGRAAGLALLDLQFDDRGKVTSSTLPDGTDVVLSFTFELASTELEIGPPSGPLVSASATYEVSAANVDGGSVQRILLGNEIVTLDLPTEVGNTIDLRGLLRLRVNALAGREVDAAPYYAQADATIDASNTALFTIDTPVGVGFDAESGHDYAVPEAAAPLELAAGGLLLAAERRRRRRAAASVASKLHRGAGKA